MSRGSARNSASDAWSPAGYGDPRHRPVAAPSVHITDRLARTIAAMGLGEPSDWVFVNSAGKQIAENKTLARLKKYALEAGIFVGPHPKTGEPWSAVRWHWLRHYHRTRTFASRIWREVSKLGMGHVSDEVHDLYRGMDPVVFHQEYGKLDTGINDDLLAQK